LDTAQPAQCALFQNYPNPFNIQTDIRYQIFDTRFPIHTTLKIYNILGQEVRTLVDEMQIPGQYNVLWDGLDNYGIQVSSGPYFYRLRSHSFSETKGMMLLK
jgi:hypothetical protein